MAVQDVSKTTQELQELIEFMRGPDYKVFARFINYFSAGGRYLKPSELKTFWESLPEAEKQYYRAAIFEVKIRFHIPW